MIKRKLTRRKLKRNPYIVDYGYHLTSHRNLKSILTNGFKRSLYNKKSNYERWILNNILYGGRSPIYFFTNADPFNSMSPELEYSLKEAEVDTILKVDVKKYDQLPDIPHLLDEGSFLLEYDEKDINKTYLELDYWDSEKTHKIFAKYFLIRKKLPILEFTKNENLMTDTIFFTETFCIADNIPPNYIVDVIKT